MVKWAPVDVGPQTRLETLLEKFGEVWSNIYCTDKQYEILNTIYLIIAKKEEFLPQS